MKIKGVIAHDVLVYETLVGSISVYPADGKALLRAQIAGERGVPRRALLLVFPTPPVPKAKAKRKRKTR